MTKVTVLLVAVLTVLLVVPGTRTGSPRPEAVLRLDRAGYAPGETKIAYLRTTAEVRAVVVGPDGADVLTPRIGPRRGGLRTVDFSALSEPGTYRLRVGGTLSRPFRVAPAADLFRPLALDAVRRLRNRPDEETTAYAVVALLLAERYGLGTPDVVALIRRGVAALDRRAAAGEGTGQMAAVFALAARAEVEEDPAGAESHVAAAVRALGLASGRGEEPGHLALGATELARTARSFGDPRAGDWFRMALGWAAKDARRAGDAALGIDDVSALANAELAAALAPEPVTALRTTMRSRLDAAVDRAGADPLGASGLGYVASAHLYEQAFRDGRYAAYATAQRSRTPSWCPGTCGAEAFPGADATALLTYALLAVDPSQL
ncbi:cellulase N-terminal Ig-like domain-containing protein [Actinoplanes sp. NPDC051494]|uniref:cellulase N-terminal Ig-like domain-containing protein n=1 Tax=Actinoplanes sp. NPDC051494 TaxID=3363907 RepID=UPI00378CDF41